MGFRNKFLYIWMLLGLLSPAASAQKLEPLLRKALTNRTSVAARSFEINKAARAKLQGLARKLPLAQIQTAQSGFPAHARRQVFQVQNGPFSHSTASAFALNIHGRVWGVTAAHVMENIHLNPHMVVENERGKLISAPIAFQHVANKNGSDVAIFEIPKELLPYVDVLQPATELPAVQTETQSPCFIRGNPVYLPSEDILFAGPHRLLLRDQAHREMTGYCGSPVLVDGKVVGLHVGSYSVQNMNLANWSSLLTDHNIRPQGALHAAAPIQRVEELAQQFEMSETPKVGAIPLKVMGHFVTWLEPQEYIYSVQHLRNDRLQDSLHSHPFINFEKLEEFFELQEKDVLRITILTPKTLWQIKTVKIYDVDVATGKVTIPRLLGQ